MTKQGSQIVQWPQIVKRSAVTLDEARLLANVNERAQRLYEDGYRIRCLDAHRYLVRSNHGGTYTVDREADTCSCPFFEKHGGRYPCKHTLGWKKLLLTQRAAIQALSARWESVPLENGIRQVQEGIVEAVSAQIQKHGGSPSCP